MRPVNIFSAIIPSIKSFRLHPSLYLSKRHFEMLASELHSRRSYIEKRPTVRNGEWPVLDELRSGRGAFSQPLGKLKLT